MSTQSHDSQQVLYPERNINDSKVRNSHNSSMNTMSLCDAKINEDTLRHLDPDATSLSKLDPKTLQDRKLSTPKTCYSYEPAFSTSANSPPLSFLSKPVEDGGLFDHASRNLTHLTRAVDEQDTSLVQLRDQLEVHFQDLKKEFEVKRGESWMPLQAWTNEEWKWDDESDAETEGVSDSH
ncbi:hypothetical protein CC77DRAFT_1046246 [Alternaria alternata]|jgi:hypothetical protein|uniref:Uncharacterized protein n=2 Tax=Alternaria alternata complex TaxID=187734 RepID=A0A177E3T1_ALTAL|nr:hypothetical protein CC77DRAFT_1046246 [Alternaria alternata]XP_051583270.1 uncharacterized protein J4E82_010781 [Alternaria postmessia]RYO12191.1 hypothetical protein AA0121_g9316 [Alternaria tenuissima]KAH6851774.1 hypothetical protein B0T12DRAFT_473172 [Alternaria alternata]KAI5368448.1 hypothetical protein J4E82_010781 [Alternaria postmessia]OAG26614.1 hypothetical protein CC77DRAFT_1046246 [Alternaria alternata]